MAGKRSREPGELESQVLRILRGFAGPVGARDIQALFEEPRPAYTSLLTILDRLRVKGLVAREELSPRKVRFSALQTSEEHASDAMLGVLGEVDDRRAVLLRFAGNLDDADVAFLRDALAAKRK